MVSQHQVINSNRRSWETELCRMLACECRVRSSCVRPRSRLTGRVSEWCLPSLGTALPDVLTTTYTHACSLCNGKQTLHCSHSLSSTSSASHYQVTLLPNHQLTAETHRLQMSCQSIRWHQSTTTTTENSNINWNQQSKMLKRKYHQLHR